MSIVGHWRWAGSAEGAQGAQGLRGLLLYPRGTIRPWSLAEVVTTTSGSVIGGDGPSRPPPGPRCCNHLGHQSGQQRSVDTGHWSQLSVISWHQGHTGTSLVIPVASGQAGIFHGAFSQVKARSSYLIKPSTNRSYSPYILCAGHREQCHWNVLRW